MSYFHPVICHADLKSPEDHAHGTRDRVYSMEASIVMGVPQMLVGVFHGKSDLEIRMMTGVPPF